jgi:hypothetical protein
MNLIACMQTYTGGAYCVFKRSLFDHINTPYLCQPLGCVQQSKNKNLHVTVAYHTYRLPQRPNFHGHVTNREEHQPVETGNPPYSQKPINKNDITEFINQPDDAKTQEYRDIPTLYLPTEQQVPQHWKNAH